MSFHPRAGISEGMLARRPRPSSEIGRLRKSSVDAVESRRGRKPAVNRAAVTKATHSGGRSSVLRSSERRIFGLPGLSSPLAVCRVGGQGGFMGLCVFSRAFRSALLLLGYLLRGLV